MRKHERKRLMGDLVVDERIILKRIFKILHWGAEWADMVQDRNKWRALVKKVMKFRGTLTAGNMLTSRETISFSKDSALGS